MDDLVEFAVFGARGAQQPLYRAKHRVGTGNHTITLDVAGEPTRAGIDPSHLLIARRGDDLSDNVRDVQVDGR